MIFRQIWLVVAALASFVSVAAAQQFNQVIVFGDSNVDSGFYKALSNPGSGTTYNNLWPSAVAHGAGAPTSNPGPMNSQVLASYFGLTAEPANAPGGGTNFATSGAKNVTINTTATGGFRAAVPTVTQMANYIAANGSNANASALYLINSGTNDINYALGQTGTGPFPADPNAYATQAAEDLAAAIKNLQTKGAQTILVTGLAYHYPGNDATERALRLLYTQQLFSRLTSKGVTYVQIDTNLLLDAIFANPSKFGFTSTSTSSGQACSQPAGITSAWSLLCSSDPAAPSTLISPNAGRTSLFADDGHFASEGQRLQADLLYTRVPPSSASAVFAATLPSGRSVQVGKAATVFATILNNTASTANGCGIAPVTTVPGTFSYQTTNPATNTLVGSPNTPTSIPAGQAQTFLIAFQANSPFLPKNVIFNFSCTGLPGAAPIIGVNTPIFTFDANPVADMIAVGLTPSNDGYARTGGNSGTGIFVIAATNIGAATSLTARVRLSDPAMTLTPVVCETFASGPNVGQCKATATSSVTRTINNNENTTWTAFLAANGAIVQDPAHNRVTFEFTDAAGNVRGSTSTAVTSQ